MKTINLTSARALDWQRHIVAVREELGLPREGTGTCSINVAAIASIDITSGRDLANFALDSRFDLIVAVWPHHSDTIQKHVIALRSLTGCELIECEFIEAGRKQPLSLYLPERDQHLMVDSRGNLAVQAGCPVSDLPRAKRRAAARLRKAEAKLPTMPGWAEFDAYAVPPSPRAPSVYATFV